jgi:iron-sulfur cluster repair protein YtfE (RIC family)
MPDTKVRSRKATDQLRDDHHRIWKLFKHYEDLDDTDHVSKYELFHEIQDELTVHAAIEEEVFYPALDRVDVEGAEESVSDAHEEHEIVKLLLGQLSSMTPEDLYFDAKMKVLSDNVRLHVEEEERHLFPLFQKLDRDEQDRIADELRRARDQHSA